MIVDFTPTEKKLNLTPSEWMVTLKFITGMLLKIIKMRNKPASFPSHLAASGYAVPKSVRCTTMGHLRYHVRRETSLFCISDWKVENQMITLTVGIRQIH